MPHTHYRTFRIRYYECYVHGHLNNANYLRYMQETAFDASAAAGYDLERYKAMERLWLVRESGIKYLQPLLYNDRVVVKTWVADFRRVSSRRVYEFYRLSLADEQHVPPEDGQLAASAYTDWAFIDTARDRPTAIPAALIADFNPEGLPQVFPARDPFPKIPPPPPGVFKTQHKVTFNDIDGMRHVNNAAYSNYVTECGMQVIAEYGWPWKRMLEAGFGIYLRRNQIQYLSPAFPDDVIEISTWASDVRRSTAKRHYTLKRKSDSFALAHVSTLSVWVNVETGKPIRIPESFIKDFKPNIVD